MKSLVTSIISVAMLALLAFTNPKITDFEQFIGGQIMRESEKADDISRTLGFLFSGFAGGLIGNATERTDYVFFSIYDCNFGRNYIKVLGILGNFFVIEDSTSGRRNLNHVPPTNKRKPAPSDAVTETRVFRVDYIPATSEHWPPINIDDFGWQHPWSVVQKTEQSRFMLLLGRNYADFAKFIAVGSWVERQGDFLVGEGCMAHDCAENKGIFTIDGKTGRSYAALISGRNAKVWGIDMSAKVRGVDKFKDLPFPIAVWLDENGVKIDWKID